MAIQLPELLTPNDVAEILKVSVDTVYRKFSGYPGVHDIGNPPGRKKRRYQVLRIPRHVVEQYLNDTRVA